MNKNSYKTKDDVIKAAAKIEGHSLREVIPDGELNKVDALVQAYGGRRRGLLGDLVEQYVFGLDNNGRPEADFNLVGIELKTTPLKKHTTKKYVSKERLVFSMINYKEIINETWETSSFLKKNGRLLILFYLWLKEQSLLDHRFKFVHFIDLLSDLSEKDIQQIKQDWEYIVAKIRRDEAHLLSESDTFYLGACTKASNSKVVRDQAGSNTTAKPRAFSLKQTYLNYLIQTRLLGKSRDEVSIYTKADSNKTVEEVVLRRFKPYIGKTENEIFNLLNWRPKKWSKHYKRLITNHILTGRGSSEIEELNKANITLRALTLEASGVLKESISFPYFDFKDLTQQVWYDEKEQVMCDLHAQLEAKKFLFVIFQKQMNSDEVILKKTMFWNFPAKDIEKARKVWEMTIELINEGKIIKDVTVQSDGKEKVRTYFPGSTFNGVMHVRPHGRDAKDTCKLPVPDQRTGRTTFTKQAFWLDSKYIQQAIETAGDQY